jgi:murein DD-endopeptidase MepM/ murein hydrolase activator NlpD
VGKNIRIQYLFMVLMLLVSSVLSARKEIIDLGYARLEGDFTQGGMVVGKAAPGTKVEFAKKDMSVGADSVFVLGFGRDDKSPQKIVFSMPDEQVNAFDISIRTREYDIQKVDGVPQRTVTPDPKDQARIDKDNAAIFKAREILSMDKYFLDGFDWPVKGRISGVYGSQRIFNGEPKNPHYGLDIAAPKGTIVSAPADGTVTMAYKDMFYSGNTVMIDHGRGINTTYLHFDKMLVKAGDKVKKGQAIGKVGKTGRATGPHLCFRLNWYQTRLDPQLVLPEQKK